MTKATRWSPGKIKALRALHRISQKDLGETCEVTTTTVSRWETGVSSPDRRAVSVLDRIQAGEITFVGKCLWCGTLHGTEVERGWCEASQEQVRRRVQLADEEKLSLKTSGRWVSIRGRAREVARRTGWDQGEAFRALADQEKINLRNAEEIIAEVLAERMLDIAPAGEQPVALGDE